MQGKAAPALCALIAIALSGAARAQSAKVELKRLEAGGVGATMGSVVVVETRQGLSFVLDVSGFDPGTYAFHVHENGDCGVASIDGKPTPGGAAGGHYDPDDTKSHRGPFGQGHRGDLPALQVIKGGSELAVTSSRLKMSDVAGRALVIHEGGDNYTDKPANGGAGARIACGVVPKP